MTDPGERFAEQLRELRTSFAQSFAQPRQQRSSDTCDLLLIGLGQRACAVRISELSGLYVDRIVTPLPTARRELIGLANLKGKLVPVYDLCVLLAEPSDSPRRWLALSSDARLALAFDELVGYLRVATSEVVASPGSQGFARELVRHQGRVQPVVSVLELVKAMQARSKLDLEQEV